jgi:hypothetical protein
MPKATSSSDRAVGLIPASRFLNGHKCWAKAFVLTAFTFLERATGGNAIEMAAYCSKRLEYSGAHSRICVVDVRYPLLSVSRGSHSEQQCVSRSCDGGWFKGRSRGAYAVRKRVLWRIRWHASLARSWVCHHPAGARTAARCPFNVRWQWNESQAELQSNLVDSQSPKTHKNPNLNLNLLSQL